MAIIQELRLKWTNARAARKARRMLQARTESRVDSRTVLISVLASIAVPSLIAWFSWHTKDQYQAKVLVVEESLKSIKKSFKGKTNLSSF